jgi:hypothetical protein
MGLQSWRGLSVLLLAGVTLVGCNNTPDKKYASGNGPTSLPGGLANQNQNQGPTQQLQNRDPFPRVQSPNNPFAGGNQLNALPGSIQGNGAANTGGLPGSIQGNGAANTSFTPGAGGQMPTFPPLPKDPVPGRSDISPQPYPGVPSGSGFAADPLRNSPSLPGGMTPIQPPQGFPGRQ